MLFFKVEVQLSPTTAIPEREDYRDQVLALKSKAEIGFHTMDCID